MEDEIKVKWPQDAKPLTGQQIRPDTPIMSADLDNQDDLSIVTFEQLSESVKEIIEITGIELAPVQGGSSSGSATVIPNGPSGQNRKMDASPGWYSVGGVPVEATSGHVWKWFWNGSSWSLVDMGELPIAEIDKTNIIIERTERVTTEQAVIAYSIPNTSDRPLPVGFQFLDLDRPDLVHKQLPVITDAEGNVIVDTNYDFKLTPDFDRPDLSGYNVFIDVNNNIISLDPISASEGGGSVGGDVTFTDLYYNPSDQEPYNIGSSGTDWINADLYNELWEPFLNDSEYVSRELMGVSTEDQLDIYKYEFRPDNPTRKVIIFGGNHGSEKIPCIVLYRFFKNLIENYSSSPALQWARRNIHYVVVPLLSPDSYERRTRRVKETSPFPATWTKSEDVVTITFEESDFPNTNPNVSASDYFSDDGIVGKTMISVINSDDQSGLPDNGYVIQSNPSGQSITIDVPSGGSSSGVCEIYVSADPNRCYDLPSNPWFDQVPSGSMTAYQEPVAVRNDNKGTKPLSLNESVIAKQVIDDNSDATFLIDFHNGAGDYDFRWNPAVDLNRTGIDKINDLHRLYTDEFRVLTTNNNVLSAYGSQIHSMNGITAEWGQHNPITVGVATDSQRWFGNLMIIGSWFYKNKL